MKNKTRSFLYPIVFLLMLLKVVARDNSDSTEEEGPEKLNKEQQSKVEPREKPNHFTNLNKGSVSERVQYWKSVAMSYYMGYEKPKEAEKIFPRLNPKNKYDVMEKAFRQASIIDPHDLDLKFSLASVNILKKNILAALNWYEEILNFDKGHFEAQLMHALYSKLNKNQDSFHAGMEKLENINSQRAEAYKEKIQIVEGLKNLTIETQVPANLPNNNHVFIVLGYALSKDGKIKKPLIERLKVAEKAAKTYPESKVIVTGGGGKQGKIEADVMYDWLVEHGIDGARIIRENMSTDTIENALFSMDIIDREGLNDVTLITSATHMRRALALFHEAHLMLNKRNERERNVSHIAYYDFKDAKTDMTDAEELVIYRDLMRTSGIWQFPGLYR